MAPSKRDVQAMVVALFTMNAGLDRARRQSKGAGALRLLQIVAESDGIRPSDIADQLKVHPSLVTRQVREAEDAGYVQVARDRTDGRAYRVRLAQAGTDEQRRLEQVGLERFAKFVAEWKPAEVRMLTSLLTKLELSKAAVAERERRSAGRRNQDRAPKRTGQPQHLKFEAATTNS